MTFKTGEWGKQAKERSKRRLEYFRAYQARKAMKPKKYLKPGLGKFGELLAEKMLDGSKMDNQSTHDISWNGQKVEVKTSSLLGKMTPFGMVYRYRFNVKRQSGKADYFLLLCVKEKAVHKAFLIPGSEVKNRSFLEIRETTVRYEKYGLNLKNV